MILAMSSEQVYSDDHISCSYIRLLLYLTMILTPLRDLSVTTRLLILSLIHDGVMMQESDTSVDLVGCFFFRDPTFSLCETS
jgi:hypothetical protein